MRNRYPGAQPFTTLQKDVFYGREEEITSIMRLIRFNRVVLLFGKSGYGKSSLLNAGILPEQHKDKNQRIHNIRFGAWIENKKETPLDICREGIMPSSGLSPLLNSIVSNDASLWMYLKSEQLSTGINRYLLVFDQFEELFSYHEPEIQEFKSQLNELLVVGTPQRFRTGIEVILKKDKSELSAEIIDQLYEPIEIKIIFAIRSDRMHLLTKLTDYIPELLINTYELKSLSRNDAMKALIEPARAPGDFMSGTFEYSPDLSENVLDFLEDHEGRIEAIQLQILAESFENLSITNNLSKISTKDIKNLDGIINNYYTTKIGSIENEEERIIAAKLMEEGLVLESERQRLSLHEGQIRELFNVTPSLLSILEKSRLLRAEPVQRGGYSYELAHDTLIEPVLKAKAIRVKKEQEEKQNRAALEQELRLQHERKKRYRARRIATFSTILSIISISSTILAYQLYLKAENDKNIAKEATIAAKNAQKISEENFIKYKSEIISRLQGEANKYREINEFNFERQKIEEILSLDTSNHDAKARLLQLNELLLKNNNLK